MLAKLEEVKQQLRQRMHEAFTGKWLRSVVQGYINYRAVPGNTESLHISLSGKSALAASLAPPRPEASPELGDNGATGGPLAPATAGAASVPPSSL
jgi:hypothetical protein